MRDHPDDVRHVANCDDCQARASFEPPGLDVDLERVWIGVASEAWASPAPWPERAAARLLGSPGLARAVVNTPSLFFSWILSSAAVLVVGALATAAANDPVVGLIAPALAGAGIAFAYGPHVDPAHELARTMAVPDRIILLARALAVFGLNAAMGLVASLLTASVVGITLGWLVPMTTVSALALAAATLTRSAPVGVFVALCAWGTTVSIAAARTNDIGAAIGEGALMPFYAAATISLIALTLHIKDGKRMEEPA